MIFKDNNVNDVDVTVEEEEENVYKNVVGEFTYHVETSDNGRRLCSVAKERELSIMTTYFQKCAQPTWKSRRT